jgi:hypothetical protein
MTSLSVDDALAHTQEAAAAMAQAGRRWGRNSKELELATKAYDAALEDYRDAIEQQREEHWAAHCANCAGCEECRVYDL